MLPTQSMNLKKVLKKVMYACMSAAMIAVPTVPAYAAQNDVIDTTRTASLTIHKYDIFHVIKIGDKILCNVYRSANRVVTVELNEHWKDAGDKYDN